jgi:hypothetical protein
MLADMIPDRDGFSPYTPHARIKGVRRKIRDQVMTEYDAELRQAVGWRKYLVKWKLNLLVEIRYRGILFMGAATDLPV